MGTNWREELASALEWWRDAGVDTLVEDEPRDWLARTPHPAPRQEAPAPVAEPLPDTLEAFLEWRAGESAPEAEWLTPRVLPAGSPQSPLMVLTDMPETDAEAELLGGRAGRLFDRILAAIGESRDTIHLAAFAWARPLTGQIPAEQESRLATLALHHIRLVAPSKLLLLGSANRVRATTSGSAPANYEDDINLFSREIVVAAIRHPRFLVATPGAKAEAWKQLLRLSRGTSQ